MTTFKTFYYIDIEILVAQRIMTQQRRRPCDIK